jgi:hypothetical protein
MTEDCCDHEHKEGEHEHAQNINDIIEDQEIVN